MCKKEKDYDCQQQLVFFWEIIFMTSKKNLGAKPFGYDLLQVEENIFS